MPGSRTVLRCAQLAAAIVRDSSLRTSRPLCTVTVVMSRHRWKTGFSAPEAPALAGGSDSGDVGVAADAMGESSPNVSGDLVVSSSGGEGERDMRETSSDRHASLHTHERTCTHARTHRCSDDAALVDGVNRRTCSSRSAGQRFTTNSVADACTAVADTCRTHTRSSRSARVPISENRWHVPCMRAWSRTLRYDVTSEPTWSPHSTAHTLSAASLKRRAADECRRCDADSSRRS
jgi:hypothetical protein